MKKLSSIPSIVALPTFVLALLPTPTLTQLDVVCESDIVVQANGLDLWGMMVQASS